jgi:cell filamentation protein
LRQLAVNPLKGDYHTPHFLKMHEFIFQDVFEWAGLPRTIAIYKEEDVLGGQSVEYSNPFDITRDIHHTLKEMRDKNWRKMDVDSLTNEFSDSLAKLWKIHPFREGNTRTTVTFCCQFIDEVGRPINRKLFEENATYVRTALVAYNAYFSDGGDYSKKEYLRRIVYDALS